MSAVLALKLLRDEFARAGIKSNAVEIVMAEADVEKIRKEMRQPTRGGPGRNSVQRIAGFLVSGEPSTRAALIEVGELLDV